MNYDNELTFVENLLRQFRIKLRYITAHPTARFPHTPEIGLQDILHYPTDSIFLFRMLDNHCNSNTIYRIKNVLLCHYILFRLPNTEEPVYAYIGPYRFSPVSKQDIMELAEHFSVDSATLLQLEAFFMDLPLVSDENLLLSIIYTLGEYLWQDSEHFSVSDHFPLPTKLPAEFVPVSDTHATDNTLLYRQIIEQRYEAEQLLMQAVSGGHLHKAELALSRMSSHQLESRADTPIRDYRNYGIILNTILRKAVEQAAVHPLQIHQISAFFALKIEQILSLDSFSSLTREMTRKYCLLAKNHSLKGYSMLIRKVITDINYDLTADLSLKKLAASQNVNASYLSTLFRKETGTTLTEYVNRRRIEYALLLLNSTEMQIQAIAVYCGIGDVAYFTKIFKKMIGTTPKEYREMILEKKKPTA